MPGHLPGGLEIAPDLSASSAEYQELREGFSKTRTTLFPQHQPVSKKVKPEALESRYSAAATTPETETFPASSMIISPSAVRAVARTLDILPTFSVSRVSTMSPLSPVFVLVSTPLQVSPIFSIIPCVFIPVISVCC